MKALETKAARGNRLGIRTVAWTAALASVPIAVACERASEWREAERAVVPAEETQARPGGPQQAETPQPDSALGHPWNDWTGVMAPQTQPGGSADVQTPEPPLTDRAYFQAGDDATGAADPNANPLDTYETRADRALGYRIRAALDADTLTAMAGQGVHLIIAEGKVTLVGVVQDEQERQKIADIIVNVAGQGQVRDRLDVLRDAKPER